MPTAALYLELRVLPISLEIELKQLLYLKRILDKEYDDPVLMLYHEMLKYKEEMNSVNDVIDLRKKFNLPLSDGKIKNIQLNDCKSFVKSTIYHSWSFRLNAPIIRRLVIFRITFSY